MFIKIKPMSVNEAWAGRRFKTPAYKLYEKAVLMMLPNDIEIPKGELRLDIIWGFSSRGSDSSNPLKLIEDILSKKYLFNDNRFYFHTLEKKIVERGMEYIEFKISKRTGKNTMDGKYL